MIPDNWKKNPAKLRQKDFDARWTKKNDQTHYKLSISWLSIVNILYGHYEFAVFMQFLEVPLI